MTQIFDMYNPNNYRTMGGVKVPKERVQVDALTVENTLHSAFKGELHNPVTLPFFTGITKRTPEEAANKIANQAFRAAIRRQQTDIIGERAQITCRGNKKGLVEEITTAIEKEKANPTGDMQRVHEEVTEALQRHGYNITLEPGDQYITKDEKLMRDLTNRRNTWEFPTSRIPKERVFKAPESPIASEAPKEIVEVAEKAVSKKGFGCLPLIGSAVLTTTGAFIPGGSVHAPGVASSVHQPLTRQVCVTESPLPVLPSGDSATIKTPDGRIVTITKKSCTNPTKIQKPVDSASNPFEYCLQNPSEGEIPYTLGDASQDVTNGTHWGETEQILQKALGDHLTTEQLNPATDVITRTELGRNGYDSGPKARIGDTGAVPCEAILNPEEYIQKNSAELSKVYTEGTLKTVAEDLSHAGFMKKAASTVLRALSRIRG